MDNSTFAVNDWTTIAGAAFAWVDHGWTMQAEATLFFAARMRGEKVQKEAFKLNFTSGVFVGYFVVPKYVSLGAELHYQRFFVAPAATAKGPPNLDNLTIAGGLRVHAPLGHGATLRCGLS